MRKPLLNLVLACATIFPSLALSDDTYRCGVEQKSMNGGWLAPDLIVGHATATDVVTVLDGVIQGYIGKPLQGKVETNNDKRITFTWVVPGVKSSSNQFANFSYRLTVMKPALNGRLSAQALNYQGPFSGAATCTVTQS